MKLSVAVVLICLASFPCHAQPAMMFNYVDQYIDRANGIWIGEVTKEAGPNQGGDPTYSVKVLQVLKSAPLIEGRPVSTVFRTLSPGQRYLIFGFNFEFPIPGQRGFWMDNGNISPVHLPPSFSLSRLQGKSLKEQIEMILSARSAEIDLQVKELSEEKKAIESGLECQRRLEQLPGHGP